MTSYLPALAAATSLLGALAASALAAVAHRSDRAHARPRFRLRVRATTVALTAAVCLTYGAALLETASAHGAEPGQDDAPSQQR